MFENKIFSKDNLLEFNTRLREIREMGGTFVTLNGCFDIPQQGHMEILNFAKSICIVENPIKGFVVAGLNSDLSVRKLKGDKRPILSEVERACFLLSTQLVDLVYIYDEDIPNNFLRLVKPARHVNDSSYGEDCVERESLDEMGGSLALFDKIPGAPSTSEIIQRIIEKNKDA
jgi:D-beta-D-heptose 7-phosphate kinase/D-beta-D-heptose 1-phosphate adenosyltransferase